MHKEKKLKHSGFSKKVNLALASSTATLRLAIAAGYCEAAQCSAHLKTSVLQCPYSMVIPVMESGMQFAMMFGQQAQEL